MARYAVWAKVGASTKIGEYEANSPEEALAMADEDREANWCPSLCHQCANEVELSDAYDPEASLMD